LTEDQFLVHSSNLPAQESGELLHLPRQKANWAWMSFFVRRLQPGDVFQTRLEEEEAAFCNPGRDLRCQLGDGPKPVGKRKDVFDGFPYTLYLPHSATFPSPQKTTCEIAECRVPSKARLEPRLITPEDVVSSLRGGGNASRQIVDVLTPSFPADKLVVIEVYTPGGNWSSYPPHKHDTHNPPTEEDLDESTTIECGRGKALLSSTFTQGSRVAEGR